VKRERFDSLAAKSVGAETDEAVLAEWRVGSGTTARPSS